MEAYNVPDQGLADMYLIQGTYSNPQFTGQLEQVEAMYSDGAPELFVDQGLYYPASYGYICPGFESTGDWEEHHRTFGLDGQDIQYNGSGNESTPYVYYPPNYGYEQSAYNPYNPYIPGAMVGVDGSLVAPHQYYVLPSYENSVMPAAYVPMVVQSTPDTIANGVAESFVNNAPSVNQADSQVAKHNLPSNYPKTSAVGNATTQRNSFGVGPEGSGANVAPGKQPMHNVASGSFLSQASSEALQARGQQGTENGVSGKASSGRTTPKPAFPPANGLSGLESRDHDQSSVHKVRPKLLYGRGADDTKVRPDSPSKQNLGPRTNNSKNQLVVKARTTRAGNPDALGNIIIFTDQYNNVNIPIDVNAKFFVIKSYSEDDVHKSIKYNMWSSTPNGNRKLNAAYEDTQRVAAGNLRPCPIYLFFSVNASGQFCGVAEMIGPVDFNKDMDFWQQDKWSGSFPVKWHFVKDLPNPNFRHIILENNENKPVTNSRDTQEIPFKKGLEMLQIFKNYTLKTSLLDDFMYYENRQQIMQEERARLLIKSYGNPYLVPLVDPLRKLQNFHDFPSVGDVNVMKPDASIQKGKSVFPDVDANSSVSIGKPSNSDISNSSGQVLADGVQNMVGELKMSSLTINSPEPESQSCTVSTTTNSEVADVVTIGSMPVKVKGAESSVFLTVGTILLDPRALKRD